MQTKINNIIADNNNLLNYATKIHVPLGFIFIKAKCCHLECDIIHLCVAFKLGHQQFFIQINYRQ